MCRLSDGSGRGDATCLSQYNKEIGIEFTSRKHSKDLLREIKEYAQEINTEKEIVIAGYYDQCIGGN